MNWDFRNAAIDTLKAGGWVDTYSHIHGTEDPGHTYHEFRGPEYDSVTGKMDWIFARGHLQVRDAEIVTDSAKDRFPSDHYIVSATVLPRVRDKNGESRFSADSDKPRG